VINYLSSIASRALHPVPPVRPRLRGRFDPAPLINESTVDRLKVTPPDSIEPPVEINRPAIFANEHKHHHQRRSPGSNAANEPDTLPVSQRDSKASFDSQPDTFEPPPPSPTIQVPIATATISKTQSPRLVSVTETTPLESGVEYAKEFERAIQTIRAARSSSTDSPHTNETIPTAIRERDSDAQAQSDLTTRRPLAPASDKAPLTRAEERRVEPRTDHANEPGLRETKTIVVREQKIIDRSERARETGPTVSPVPAITPSNQPQQEHTKPPPVFVQTRIAPLIEKGVDGFSPGRPTSQPQPIVRVTIGRIEVRAVHASQSQSPAKPRATPPVMNLDDYLRRRSQGGTR
jgi:hypothetical protein